jgi:hypothetical protein
MKRLAIPITLLVVVAACSSDARRRYVEYADTYTAAVETLADAIEAKTISAEDGRSLQGYLKIWRKRINEYKEALARGEKRSTGGALLDSVLDAMVEYQRQFAFAKDKQE